MHQSLYNCSGLHLSGHTHTHTLYTLHYNTIAKPSNLILGHAHLNTHWREHTVQTESLSVNERQWSFFPTSVYKNISAVTSRFTLFCFSFSCTDIRRTKHQLHCWQKAFFYFPFFILWTTCSVLFVLLSLHLWGFPARLCWVTGHTRAPYHK